MWLIYWDVACEVSKETIKKRIGVERPENEVMDIAFSVCAVLRERQVFVCLDKDANVQRILETEHQSADHCEHRQQILILITLLKMRRKELKYPVFSWDRDVSI